MKIKVIDPPRVFETGRGDVIRISDCARIALDENEQVTFTIPSGGEYDVARKSWGFYATPSLNGRLLNFGLRAALVKNYSGKYYIFLVERGKEEELQKYMDKEINTLVRWLDNESDLAQLHTRNTNVISSDLECICGAARLESVHMYFAPPAGEVSFKHVNPERYRREIFRCNTCGHFLSMHRMDVASFYEGGYVDSTYVDAAGLLRTFARINALPPSASDNVGRVERVDSFVRSHNRGSALSVLDVGSGTCVFLSAMKNRGWRCTALDPDSRAIEHARRVVGIDGVRADFQKDVVDGKFDLVTFNKVLEHVKDPVVMLKKALTVLARDGLVYIELPDGEAASVDGFHREEFFIEHYHVFSAASIALLAQKACFRPLIVERLREPSSKYTLRAFLAPIDAKEKSE